jgi:hypothetical protein
MTLYSRAETDAQSLKVLNTTVKDSVDKYDHDNTLIVDGDSTVQGAQGYSTAARRVVFIDETEATLAENKSRGLTAPGWWEYMTFTDASGRTRHKAQHLTSFKSAPANVADADDDVAADIIVLITINTQPADTSVATGAALSLVVDAIATPPGDASVLTYQWQKKSGRRWVNVGADQATYDVAVVTSDDAGDYRVKITSSNGAKEVTSDTAAVTVTV